MKFATVLVALASTALAVPYQNVESETAATSLDIGAILKGFGDLLISGDIIRGIANANAKGIPLQDIGKVVAELLGKKGGDAMMDGGDKMKGGEKEDGGDKKGDDDKKDGDDKKGGDDKMDDADKKGSDDKMAGGDKMEGGDEKKPAATQ
ncbi:hypothetical protein K4F52_009093 [Lecanicillium sp. MT-2017a]|nr:hypothetical protein K4F52_009093 [Lecanicillium sp. MT-2017a]